MKSKLLLSVSVVVLINSIVTARAADECNFNLACEGSRFEYWLQHGNQPPAKLITTPANPQPAPAPAPSQPAAPVASAADIASAQKDINSLLVLQVITKDQADKASNLIAAGGGNLIAAGGGNVIAAGGGNVIAAGGGNVIAAGGGNVVSNDGGSIIAANALALVPGGNSSALKMQVATALLSTNGGNLQQKADAMILTNANLVAIWQSTGLIDPATAKGLNSLVAAGGGNVIAAGGGNVIAAGGGNVVAAGGGNIVTDHASGLQLSTAAANIIAAGGGNVIAAGGGNVIAAGGGNLVSNAGGTLVGNAGGTLVGNAGGTLVGNAGGTLVGNAGGTLVGNAGGTLVGNAGGTLIGNAGGAAVANINALMVEKGNELMTVASIKPGYSVLGLDDKVGAGVDLLKKQMAQDKAASQAMDALNASAATVLKASDLVKRDAIALQNAKNGTDQSLAAQLQTKYDADIKSLGNLGAGLLIQSGTVNPKDKDAAQAVIDKTGLAVVKDSNDAGAAVAALKPAPATGPSDLQKATMANAVRDASTAANTATKTNTDLLALMSQVGSRPTNTNDLMQVNRKMADVGVDTAKADLAKQQSALVTMSANKAKAADIQAQRDTIAAAQKTLDYQTGMRDGDYAGKHIVADNAAADLQKAKDVVDGLTKAYGSTRPADPKQNATITTAMMVVGLAQDKADQTLADALAVRLKANGASNNDVQSQKDISAARTKDMQGILNVNKTVLASAGLTNANDPAAVMTALTNVVAAAGKDSTAAVQTANSKVAAANAAVQAAQNVKTASVAPVETSSAWSAVQSSLTQASQTITTKAAAAANEAAKSASNTASGDGTTKLTSDQNTFVQQTLNSIPGNLTSAEKKKFDNLSTLANRATNKGLTGDEAATLKSGLKALAERHPKAEKQVTLISDQVGQPRTVVQSPTAALSDAVSNQLIAAGPVVIQGLQAQRDAAAKAGNTALATGLDKDIVSLKGQIDQALKQQAALTAPVGPPAKQGQPISTNPLDPNRKFVPEHSPNMHPNQPLPVTVSKPPLEPQGRNKLHEVSTQTNQTRGTNQAHSPSTATRNAATYTAASTSKAPPPPKVVQPTVAAPKIPTCSGVGANRVCH